MARKALMAVLIIISLVVAAALAQQTRTDDSSARRSFAGTTPAPEFPTGLDWLNTETPLTLEGLKGKVVLLDFWTYGCINCIHIIPDLKKLEEKYADELVVIGVHSAKFDNESVTENIRNVVMRYELEHPVVNDENFEIWRSYAARAWPTLVLIDPAGNVVGSHSGEGIFEPFDEAIGGVIEEFDAQGLIDRTPLEIRLEGTTAETPLRFPGKVLADEEMGRLFIADSNHNRIVVTDLEGRVQTVIGDGKAGLEDGSFSEARFFRPQGITLAGASTLYVADTENHAIRKIDFATERVETVAGTGKQGYLRVRQGPALELALNSPWDVLYHTGTLYIAMAGQHQLWSLDLQKGVAKVHAGTGREELKDGYMIAGGLNQPSGLATDGEKLFFADSEASAIRTADLFIMGQLDTIVGTGLFDFGDVDGVGDDVRLQHPLGIDFHDGSLYVADTYNSKIKLIDPLSRRSTTLLGSEVGWRDGPAAEAQFNEPGGLSTAGNKLYIADTNNHVIRVADLTTQEVETLVLIDTEGLLTRRAEGEAYQGLLIRYDPQQVTAGERQLELTITLPEGYQLNDLAPFSMTWQSSGDAVLLGEDAEQTIVKPDFPLQVSLTLQEGAAMLTGELVVYYCEYDAVGLCLIDEAKLELPITVTPEGRETVEASYAITAPSKLDSF
ncbi:MAG: redoxin domain-containing protein [Trueperaceae bacterium]|nr:MAG: redoxin domain-containing protein [Trueperaceae bacterium]